MRSRSSWIGFAPLLFVAAASCVSPAKAPPPPMLTETPPLTKDPGAVRDERPLQGSPSPDQQGAGTRHAPPVEGRPDGASCVATIDCASGVCEGIGCTEDRPGRCAPRARACTKDLRPYCGCDGKTFTASGSCPGRRFLAPGECR